MPKLIWGQTTLFLTAAILLNASVSVASAPLKKTTLKHKPAGMTISQNRLPVSLNSLGKQRRKNNSRLLDLFRRRGKDAATRGGRFCPIAPSSGSRVTWDPRPAFAWQGDVIKIQVIQSGGQILWEQEIQPGQQHLLYPQQQEALKTGQTYYVVMKYLVFHDDGTLLEDDDGIPVSKIKRIPIEVLDDETLHQEIAEKLKNLKDPTQEKQASSRAEYFASQQLFLDVVRELVSLSEPSSGWERQTNNLKKTFCDPA